MAKSEANMANAKVELFVHCHSAKPKKLSADSNECLRDVMAKAGVVAAGDLIFVGEWAEALKEPDDVDDGDDSHEPIDAGLTLEQLKIRGHDHIHCHKCRRVAVEVNYGPHTKRHKFSPATTVEVVTKWAKKKFKLDDAAAADLILQKCGTTERPRPNQHLGEIVEAGNCMICFDLVKEVTPQG